VAEQDPIADRRYLLLTQNVRALAVLGDRSEVELGSVLLCAVDRCCDDLLDRLCSLADRIGEWRWKNSGSWCRAALHELQALAEGSNTDIQRLFEYLHLDIYPELLLADTDQSRWDTAMHWQQLLTVATATVMVMQQRDQKSLDGLLATVDSYLHEVGHVTDTELVGRRAQARLEREALDTQDEPPTAKLAEAASVPRPKASYRPRVPRRAIRKWALSQQTPFSQRDLVNQLGGGSAPTIRSVLQQAIDQGELVEVESRRGPHPARYIAAAWFGTQPGPLATSTNLDALLNQRHIVADWGMR
jgi:hypothetical protein